MDSTGSVVNTVTSNVPDLLLVNGTLDGTDNVHKGATVSIRFRRGEPFKGEPGCVWSIYGEKGEIRLTAVNGPTFHAAADKENVFLELHDFETDILEKIDWDWSGWAAELPMVARSIGNLYDKYASGQNDTSDGVPSFRTALHRHQQLENFLSQWKQ